ncbi:hypothetical protein MHBO_002940, partial [Bonamia ostreae]
MILKNTTPYNKAQQIMYEKLLSSYNPLRAECLVSAWINYHHFRCKYNPEVEKIIEQFPHPKTLQKNEDESFPENFVFEAFPKSLN